MRIEGERESENVEDRRGMPVKAIGAGGGLVTIVVIIIALLTGKDPTPLLNQITTPPGQTGQVTLGAPDPREEPLMKFSAVVLGETEDVWGDLLPRAANVKYVKPTLVLFSGKVESSCGFASAATGPFYCPVDQKLYLDLSFFAELQNRFKAPGDFAMAYVIAHEVGHHVQNLLGVSDQVHESRKRLSDAEYNKMSVRLELQADYLAGVWANRAQKMKNILESGDIDEALRAASAVGDDTLQKQAQGYVVPDAFTHGTSAQRAKWFRKGFDTGELPGMKQLFDLAYEAL
jgi:predicted metalloprotease